MFTSSQNIPKKWLSLATVFIFVTLMIIMMILPLQAQPAQPDRAQLQPTIISSVKVDTSPPLSSMEPVSAVARGGQRDSIPVETNPLFTLPKADNPTQSHAPDAALQDFMGLTAIPTTSVNFEGINNIAGVYPPDTVGDVGPNHYIQMVNLHLAIYDKQGNTLVGPIATNAVWEGFGGACEFTNDGDPIVLYDHLADRWLISQFAVTEPSYECIAISKTADPTGEWYRYAFEWPNGKFNDYPKLGVWPDGYYITANQFIFPDFAWGGAGVGVYERDKMLLGQPARFVYFDVADADISYGGLLPADLDGVPPTPGTPNLMMSFDDGDWGDDGSGNSGDRLYIWEFAVDWQTPTNSTFGNDGLPTTVFTDTVTPFTAPVCNGYRGQCIDQPDTTVKLEALSDRLMHRLQYRVMDGEEVLVVNHSVDADGNSRSGLRWYEIRNDGGGWNIEQQGTYAPDDGEHRWMGSAAMDASGNIAIGYSVASTNTYPSIRYTARLAGDPAGTMPQGEGEIIAGTGSQTGTAARWGDYSSLNVDPTDECTFWFTTEYIETTGAASWQTRIAAFTLPSCTANERGLLNGTITEAGSGDPVQMAIVNAGAFTTMSDEDGNYQFINIPVGTYDMTVDAYGYTSGSATGVAITDGMTTTQDFELTAVALVPVSGTVTDGSEHGWPLYAKITIEAAGFGENIYTDPTTGAYDIMLAANVTHTFSVEAMSDGYIGEERFVVPVDGPNTEDFELLVDIVSCTAPGYALQGPFAEGFDTSTLPDGWTIVDYVGDGDVWAFNDPGGRGNLTGGDGGFAIADSDDAGNVLMVTGLQTPSLDMSSETTVTLEFDTDFTSYSGTDDYAAVFVSIDGGTTWVETPVWEKIGGYAGPAHEVIDISSYAAGEPDVMLEFYYDALYEYWWQIDNVRINTPCAPVDGSLVQGNVYDANTDEAIDGAMLNFADMTDYTDGDGFYLTFMEAGSTVVTASLDIPTGYGLDVQTVNVVSDAVIPQDFYLPAAMFETDPVMIDEAVITGKMLTMTLTLSNVGALDADYGIFEVNYPWMVPAQSGPWPFNTRVVGPKALNAVDGSGRRTEALTDVPILTAGEVITSWDIGLDYGWGIGYNFDENDLWIGNIGIVGGDDLNYRFMTDGTVTTDTIDTSPWVAAYGGDMTYNPFTGMLWQVNVGGDNCIYEMDPISKISTGNSICPNFGTSQRGLAFDPLTNTYFSGSWNDDTIHRFDSDGNILQSKRVQGVSIAGLAFNPSTGHLFVSASASDGLQFYVLDVNNDYSVVGGFSFDEMAIPAGLEIDCNGHLWAVDQGNQQVHEVDSSETGICDWQDIPWLDVTPVEGSLDADGTQSLTVVLDTTGLEFGTYEAHLRIGEWTPYYSPAIPVKMEVIPYWHLYLPVVNTP